MTRSHGHPGSTSLPRRLAGATFSVAVLAPALLGAPVASAALAGDVVAVGAGAGSVTEVPTDALPDVPVPVETPDLPKVPAPAPSAPVSKLPPRPSTPPVPSAAATVHHLGDGAEEKGIVRAPSEAEEPGTGARAVTGRADRRSIGPAETAPLRRLRAYVWPAIALRVRNALMPLLARFDAFVDGVPVSGVFGLSPPAVSGPLGIDVPSGRRGLPIQDLRSRPEVALPEDGTGLLETLLIGFLMAAGLLALVRLAVGEELFETRHWRGHSG